MSQLKAAAGTAAETLDVATPCTVHELVKQVVERHGEPLRRLLCDGQGQLLPSLLVCVGDAQVSLSDSTPLSDGDRVTLLTPISGG